MSKLTPVIEEQSMADTDSKITTRCLDFRGYKSSKSIHEVVNSDEESECSNSDQEDDQVKSGRKKGFSKYLLIIYLLF